MKNREKLLQQLYSNADVDYKNFTKKLIPGDFQILGVRIPILKSLVKKMTEEEKNYLMKMDKSEIFELNMLKALTIANLKEKNIYRLYFDKIYPEIDNWSICDTFIATSKIIKKDKEYYFNRAQELLKSKKEYDNRIAFVIILNYFIDEEYIHEIFPLIYNYRSDKYYANMALAWLLSEMYVRFPEKTKIFLLNSNLDKEVIRMSIRKIKDSYRVDIENKEWLKKLVKLFS